MEVAVSVVQPARKPGNSPQTGRPGAKKDLVYPYIQIMRYHIAYHNPGMQEHRRSQNHFHTRSEYRVLAEVLALAEVSVLVLAEVLVLVLAEVLVLVLAKEWVSEVVACRGTNHPGRFF